MLWLKLSYYQWAEMGTFNWWENEKRAREEGVELRVKVIIEVYGGFTWQTSWVEVMERLEWTGMGMLRFYCWNLLRLETCIVKGLNGQPSTWMQVLISSSNRTWSMRCMSTSALATATIELSTISTFIVILRSKLAHQTVWFVLAWIGAVSA